MDTHGIGDLGERIAESFLRLKGYEILRRNYRCAGREIDLLVRRRSDLVAVEVKLRRGDRFGSAIEAIDRRKISRVQTALQCALRDAAVSLRPRMDVIVIDVSADMTEMRIRHVEAVTS